MRSNGIHARVWVMRTRTFFGILVAGLAVAAAGVSLWILRQPLRETYVALRGDQTVEGSAIRFAVVGDNHGDNPVYRQILQDVRAQRLDFLLNLADATEYGLTDEFTTVKALESPLSFPVYHTVGNHDIKTDASRGLFRDAFGHSGWIAYDHDSLHLIILDNADRKVGFPAESLRWLADDLAANRDKTIIIAYHRPFDLPLGQVIGDDETAASRATNSEFKKIIAGYPVKYIFTSHLHTYLPYTVDDIPAIVSGGGGDPAQTVLGGPSANLFHYLLVTVQGDDVSIQVQRVQLRAEG